MPSVVGEFSSARARLLLLVVSATLLFVELLLLRWIPANIIYVGFFNNFLLIASFFGSGLGILLGRDARPRATITALLLAAVGILVLVTRVDLRSTDREFFFGASDQLSLDVNFVVLPLVVSLVAAVMAALAVLYLIAALFATRWRMLGDRALAAL